MVSMGLTKSNGVTYILGVKAPGGVVLVKPLLNVWEDVLKVL